MRNKNVAWSIGVGLLMQASLAWGARVEFRYTMSQLDDSWKVAFVDNEPLLYDLFKSFKDEVFAYGTTPPALGRPSTGGFGHKPGTPALIEYFPVRSFPAEPMKRLLGASAHLGLLKTRYEKHIGFQNDNVEGPVEVLQKVLKQRQTAIELERFTVAVAFYLNAEKMAQKCNFYREAKGIGTSLGLDGSRIAEVPDGWQTFLQEARSFYQDGSKGLARIPAHICSLSTVQSRGAVEDKVTASVDTNIADLMRKATEDHHQILQKRLGDLGQDVRDSAIDIPVRGVFALDKGFKDTNDLLNLVRSDLLGLYTAKQGLSLMQQIEARLKNMDGSRTRVKDANDKLQAFSGFMQTLLRQLEALPLTQGLGATDREQLGVCLGLSKVPTDTPTALQEYQDKFTTCLTKTAEVYGRIRNEMKDDPEVREFAKHLGSLANLYLSQWN
ncbi:MAG: hypothetical protein M3Q07_26075 [Pseudobdellovibrionaceae bacterium]|nr:hypothetical protein [Pseudobdellovibrionaceae bacterium]